LLKETYLNIKRNYHPMEKGARAVTEPYAGEAGIWLHIFGKFLILKLKSSHLS
jgi:hypothetical protein